MTEERLKLSSIEFTVKGSNFEKKSRRHDHWWSGIYRKSCGPRGGSSWFRTGHLRQLIYGTFLGREKGGTGQRRIERQVETPQNISQIQTRGGHAFRLPHLCGGIRHRSPKILSGQSYQRDEPFFGHAGNE